MLRLKTQLSVRLYFPSILCLFVWMAISGNVLDWYLFNMTSLNCNILKLSLHYAVLNHFWPFTHHIKTSQQTGSYTIRISNWLATATQMTKLYWNLQNCINEKKIAIRYFDRWIQLSMLLRMRAKNIWVKHSRNTKQKKLVHFTCGYSNWKYYREGPLINILF